jgi:hypothetical protein
MLEMSKPQTEAIAKAISDSKWTVKEEVARVQTQLADLIHQARDRGNHLNSRQDDILLGMRLVGEQNMALKEMLHRCEVRLDNLVDLVLDERNARKQGGKTKGRK